MQIHQEHPRASAAQFLCAVSQSFIRGFSRDSRQMQSVDMVKWAQELTNLKELRDSREVAALMDMTARVKQDRLAEAMDVCAQRVEVVCIAKAPKGSCEKPPWWSSLRLRAEAYGSRQRWL